jgi:uncharacterized damage-inducible protein DinB
MICRCRVNPTSVAAAELAAVSGKEARVPADDFQSFRAFARNNAWANYRLAAACGQLSQDEFEAKRTGFFPSLQETLNHIYGIDLLYIDALEGGRLGPKAFENPVLFPALPELSRAQALLDKRLIALCDAMTGENIGRDVHINRGTHVQIERCDRVLMHLFQHQIHHRGQAHAMLSGTKIEPPQLDEFFLADEAKLRAQEFAELGWKEADIWR